ncbi:tryptophan-rich sensory protein [soil metagenome]
MKTIPLSIKLTISILACLILGGLSGISTTSAITGWYTTLIKPAFNPPNWIFGPAWTLLYILMGISFALIWNKGWEKKEVKNALGIFIIQLVLNLIWSVLFFAMQNPAIAFIDIIILWMLIFLTIKKFFPINKIAAYLLIPYLLWVSFATLLNASIWYLN